MRREINLKESGPGIVSDNQLCVLYAAAAAAAVAYVVLVAAAHNVAV